MPRPEPLRRPTVILHGWQGSGPAHWQTWLAEQLRADGVEVRYPDLPNADQPVLADWLAALDGTLLGLPADGYDVICHSLAVPLWLWHVTRGETAALPARVLLVAPPSPTTAIPEIAEFFPPPLDADAVRTAAGGTVLIATDDDPYCQEGAAVAYGKPLRIPTTVLEGAGHLNTDAGYGPWPAVQKWCQRPNLAFPL